jgi:predicted transcriptional regulator
MGEEPLSLHLEEKLRQGLEEEARLREVPETEIAEEAIREFLNRQAWMRREIEVAVREADKGVFISQEAMERWIDSWGTENELPPPEPDVFLPPKLR